MLPPAPKKTCVMTVRKDVDCNAVWVAWQLKTSACSATRAVQDKTTWQDGSCEHDTCSSYSFLGYAQRTACVTAQALQKPLHMA